MSDGDLIKLYSSRILELASAIPHLGRLPAPGATSRKRSPICGSVVTVDLVMDQGRVVNFAQDVKACALGQASAAVLGAAILGRTADELRIARDQLRAMLKDQGPSPDAPFDGYQVLIPARDYRNRHASILLALEASVEAVEMIEAGQKA